MSTTPTHTLNPHAIPVAKTQIIASWEFAIHHPCSRLAPATFVENPYLSNVHQIYAGSDHLCAVHDNNKISCWGFNAKHQLGPATSERNHESVLLDIAFY